MRGYELFGASAELVGLPAVDPGVVCRRVAGRHHLVAGIAHAAHRRGYRALSVRIAAGLAGGAVAGRARRASRARAQARTGSRAPGADAARAAPCRIARGRRRRER
ncbi:hypothetical protein G6F23_015232 [Rhizopus arrhizus]|nr:hypothetical protein G6F23_015232 [Rhizopus arrhizus]